MSEHTPEKAMPDIEKQKELPFFDDKIQQIFKFLEIADVSQWQAMNVFEAGDADTLHGILKTALEQSYAAGRQSLRAEIEGMYPQITNEVGDEYVKKADILQIISKE